MSSRFRNELTIVPGVRIAVKSGGVSTTIDWRDRRNGVAGSSRALLQIGDPRLSGPLPTDRFLIPGTRKDFGDGDVADMTSPGLDKFKELLIATRQRDREIRRDIGKAKRQALFAKAVKVLGWITLTSALLPSVRASTSKAVALRKDELAVLNTNLAGSEITVNFDLETEIGAPFQRMQEAFDQLLNAQHAWAIPVEQQINRVKARSLAGTVVSRVRATLNRHYAHLVGTKDPPPTFRILRGKATAYFYPGFVLVDGGTKSDEVALIDLTQLEIGFTATSFTESESVPTDAETIGLTWAKANKDGSRDRRFKDNRQLPILRYGSLEMSGKGGLHELFMFSDVRACQRFVAAVSEIKKLLVRNKTAHSLQNNKLLGH